MRIGTIFFLQSFLLSLLSREHILTTSMIHFNWLISTVAMLLFNARNESLITAHIEKAILQFKAVDKRVAQKDVIIFN